MRKLIQGLAACLLFTSATGFAATDMPSMNMKPSPSTNANSQAPRVDAEVKKIDRAAGRITLKHGPIETLKMGAMTMSFPVKDKASLSTVKEGDKVAVTFDKINDVATVTSIAPR